MSAEITNEELQEAIARIKLGKAQGMNGVTPEMIRFMGESAEKVLKDLVNDIIREKKIPTGRMAQGYHFTAALFKKGDKRDYANYHSYEHTSEGKYLPQ